MSKYFKTTGIFFAVWFMASILNGFLSGMSIAFLSSSSVDEAMSNLFLSIALSFVFSAPVVGLVWFITIVAQLTDKKGDSLFQFVLGTTLSCSLAAALFFIVTIGSGFINARYAAGFSIVFSALSSVLFFRKNIKANV